MSNITKKYDVDVTRVDTGHYRATNAAGASLEFGQGEGLLSPVELLLAAVAGCSAVDVDVVTSRRTEPELFGVHVEGTRVNEDGASRLSDVNVEFSLRFPDTDAGRQAQSMVERLVRISHEKDCTVSRTVENPTNVTFRTTQP
ncbi:OsmC family protein [Corynebacterium aurimucosum]|uniref:Putative redox protein, regulator of disulfide bond formation n=1 Tax=Corynebacterium aurimucosum (strain ATCC 700975 / DSM 44827 / CIP 107346 / CN-1) TaxID=548476 RepID=C3PEW8_CORA7|nr:OsmC family protein [Corynebacterium aurimucosum]ACP32372.1 putative redox protein, regulator of disulfide bond formation [Corynebacterium aurimucosum ATCC 700975]QQU93441.1 OsmC family protein [Corynebacterium aurimucosum]